MTREELVKEFADCVAAQSSAITRGDAETGNVFAARYIRAFHLLRDMGDAGRDALVILFTDDRAEVRITAACYLLRHSGERARQVLEKEAAGRGLTAFSASQALLRWAEGAWDLDRV
jgi:hypothetical protein